jgi:hypothetical protein
VSRLALVPVLLVAGCAGRIAEPHVVAVPSGAAQANLKAAQSPG